MTKKDCDVLGVRRAMQRLRKDVSGDLLGGKVLKTDGSEALLIADMVESQREVSRARIEVRASAQGQSTDIVLSDHGRFQVRLMSEFTQ